MEIKSTEQVKPEDTKSLANFVRDLGNAEAFILSRDHKPKKVGKISALHWTQGLTELGVWHSQ